MIRDNVFLPLFYQWQRRSFLNFLQQAADKLCCQFSERVASLICWSVGVNKNAETCIVDMATEPPSPIFCYDDEIRLKTNMEPSWNKTSVFLGNDEQIFPEQLRAHGISTEEYMGLLTDFMKKMQQTQLNPRHLIHVEVPLNSLLLNITAPMNAHLQLH